MRLPALSLLLLVLVGCSPRPPEAQWAKSKRIAGREQGFSHICGLAADEQFLYVAMGGTLSDQKAGHSGLRKVALDSGAVTVLDDGSNPPQALSGGLAIDEERVYWNAAGRLMSVSKGGGQPTVLAYDNVGGSVDLAVDAERLYWANHGFYRSGEKQKPASIWMMPKLGGKPAIFADSGAPSAGLAGSPHSLAADEQFLYWLTATAIFKQAKQDGQAQVVYQAGAEEGVDVLSQDAESLYFGFREAGKSRWSLQKLSKQGGAPQTLVKTFSLKPIIVTETEVYFFDEGGLTTDWLCRVPKQGGQVARLDSGHAGGFAALGKTLVYISSLDDVYGFAR